MPGNKRAYLGINGHFLCFSFFLHLKFLGNSKVCIDFVLLNLFQHLNENRIWNKFRLTNRERFFRHGLNGLN